MPSSQAASTHPSTTSVSRTPADSMPAGFDADWMRPAWRTPGVSAVMTTRRGGVSAAPFDSLNLRPGIGDEPDAVAGNRSRLAAAIGAVPVYLNQVHGTRVVRLRRPDAQADAAMHEADASVSTEPGVVCAVQVADCLPVLFAAPGAVAAAHAGWRGLSSGVLEATLAALIDAAGCAPEQVEAWLGPCIGPRSFEVGADVLSAFGCAPGDEAAPHAVSACFVPTKPGKWLADLDELARLRLAACGVGSITGACACTVETPSRFFSFRRDGVTGRMVAAVWLVA